jgi:hypothetical protein
MTDLNGRTAVVTGGVTLIRGVIVREQVGAAA